MLLILLVVLGIVAIIVLNILKVNCRVSSLPPSHSCLLAWEHACGQPSSAHLSMRGMAAHSLPSAVLVCRRKESACPG
jgi:hypothetical protein